MSSSEPTVKEGRSVAEIQETLELLQREILWPYYEPVERIRITNARAISVQDIMEALYIQTYRT